MRWNPYVEALVLAILLGAVLRTIWTPGPRWRPGIEFSDKTLLEVAVVLLGSSVNVVMVMAAGPELLLGVAVVVAMALGASYGLARALRLPRRVAVLIAVGNSICGNSAIAAVAPVIGASSDEIASSIAFTVVLGVVVVLALPGLVPLLGLSAVQYGIVAGLTVYAVPQVLAATAPMGALAIQSGVLIKLVRVLMLGPLVLAMSLIAAGRNPARVEDMDRSPSLRRLIPWFIIGFLALASLRSAGFIPELKV